MVYKFTKGASGLRQLIFELNFADNLCQNYLLSWASEFHNLTEASTENVIEKFCD